MPAGAWLAIAGGAVLTVGSLLPWVSATTAIGGIQRNGFQLGANQSVTVDGPLCLLLGILTAVIGVTSPSRARMPWFLQRSSIVTGVVAGVLLAIEWPGIHNLVDQIVADGAGASVGYGYWVCAVGAVLAVVGGFVLRTPGEPVAASWLALLIGGAAVVVLLGLAATSGGPSALPRPPPPRRKMN